MRHLILFCTILLLAVHADAQSGRKTRTISTVFSKNGTVSGDTTFFNYSSGNTNLLLFIYRNIRVKVTEYRELELGSCNLYFIVNTDGKVTTTWCDSVTNKAVEDEVLKMAVKLPIMKPTTIKGKPVITKVMASVIVAYGKDNEPYTGRQADILVIAYDPNYKKAIGR